MTNEQLKIIALRFLKETKLLTKWKQYIRDCQTKKNHAACAYKITKDNWYEYNTNGKKYEHNIFGATLFSDYLRYNGFNIKYPTHRYFATYLKEKNYNIQTKLPPAVALSKEEFLQQFPNIEL